VGITDDSKVFHSFRHTFKDALRTAGVPEDLNDALAGQKNSSVGRSYGAKQKSGAKDIVRRFGMSRLRDAVYGVKYEGLKLSIGSIDLPSGERAAQLMDYECEWSNNERCKLGN
jgi:hypothetical protein